MLVHDSKLKIHDMTLNIGAGGRRRTHSHTDIKKSARKINMHRLRFIIFFVAMVAAVFATVTFSSPIKQLKSDEKWYLIFIIDLKKHHTHELWTITDRFTDINFQQENILSLSLSASWWRLRLRTYTSRRQSSSHYSINRSKSKRQKGKQKKCNVEWELTERMKGLTEAARGRERE